jgi:hypothetical protein
LGFKSVCPLADVTAQVFVLLPFETRYAPDTAPELAVTVYVGEDVIGLYVIVIKLSL